MNEINAPLDDLIREQLKWHYEAYSDKLEKPKHSANLLKALRLVHNYYSTTEQRISKSKKERKLRKKARIASCFSDDYRV